MRWTKNKEKKKQKRPKREDNERNDVDRSPRAPHTFNRQFVSETELRFDLVRARVRVYINKMAFVYGIAVNEC